MPVTTQHDRERMSAIIGMRVEKGERLARRERTHLWAETMEALHEEIAPLLKAGKLGVAIDKVAAFVAANLMLAAERREALEDRVAALEAAGIKFKGTWQRASEYARGEVVIVDGSSWIALHAIKPNEKPGVGDGWHIMAMRGRDGKDRK